VLDPRVSAKPFLYTYNTRASVVAQLAMPTGQTIAYARDAEGRLLSTTLSGTAHQTLATHAYTYDLAGQRTTATTASATTAYTYDALRQLATATETPAGTGQTPTREFAYAYDPIGNRLTAATAAETTTYTANSVNQYTAIVSQISNSQISDTPTYDANGNTTTLPSGLVLDYDEENRLVSAATLTAREEYTYDGLGRRVERRTFTASSGLTAPATTTRYVYDGWRVLEELTSTQSSPFTLHSSYSRGLDLSGTLEGAGGIGGLLAMTRDPAGSATSAYYFHDGNGNVSTLVSASDALLASYTYTPFGDTLTATGTWASVNAYRFSAKECDAFTGLYYYGLRYYNPGAGRWINRDPIQEKGGENLYGCVFNNLGNWIDPLGLRGEASRGRAAGTSLLPIYPVPGYTNNTTPLARPSENSLNDGRVFAGVSGSASLFLATWGAEISVTVVFTNECETCVTVQFTNIMGAGFLASAGVGGTAGYSNGPLDGPAFTVGLGGGTGSAGGFTASVDGNQSGGSASAAKLGPTLGGAGYVRLNVSCTGCASARDFFPMEVAKYRAVKCIIQKMLSHKTY